MIQSAALAGSYNHQLSALAVLIAIVVAYAALDMAGRVVNARGRSRGAWVGSGAVAIGIGIWATNYMGMEAYQLPVPVEFDWPPVLDSLMVCILGMAAALSLVSRPGANNKQVVMGSVVMGCGIATMHQMGVNAMRMPARASYSLGLVALSWALAIGSSYLGLRVSLLFREGSKSRARWRACGALAVGLSIPVTHAVAMYAVHFTRTAEISGGLRHAVTVTTLGFDCAAIATLLILALVYNVTMADRMMAERTRRLEQSRLQLQSVFDNLNEAIVVADMGYNIVHMNRAASELLGVGDVVLSREGILQCYEFFWPNGEPIPEEQWPGRRALRGDFCHNEEVMIRRTDTGKVILVEMGTAPIRSASGETIQVIVNYRDIGERKRNDELRTRLAAIVESTEDAIIGKDSVGLVTSWNRGAEKIFGFTEAEMLGRPLTMLMPAGHEAEETEILERVSRGETVEHVETTRRRKDGEIIHVSMTTSPIHDGDGRVVGASKIARDITARKMLERQLRQSQKLEAIGQLTGGIAHDFNNLLGVIVGNVDLLERMVEQDEEALKRVRTTQTAAARGSELTRRLLAFANGEDLRPAVVAVAETVQNTIELAARALGPEIKVTTHLDLSVPDIFVDASGLESALINLLVNSRDAMAQGGELTVITHLSKLDDNYPAVRTGEVKAGRYACITVLDNGQGMSRETLERAFEPFYTTKARGKGTGLGLAMVYGFVKQSRGTVRMSSEPGYGTTVSMYLPLADGQFAAEPVAAQNQTSIRLSGKVLVVDDEPDLLEIAGAYLAEMGYKMITAKDSAGALEALRRDRTVDLMMTDIVMPGGMNGVELARKVHELRPGVKIIYCSGYPADALEKSGTEIVGGPLLRKPYQRAEFAAAVRYVMEGGSMETIAVG